MNLPKPAQLCFILLASSASHAQSPDTLPTLEVSASLPAEQTDPVVTSQLIEAEQWQGLQLTHLDQLLASQAGLQLVDIHGRSGQHLSMQGLSPDQVLILLDGRPLARSSGDAVNLSQVSLAQLERVEIIRGAGSARYGNRAMAGVILLHSKKPASPSAQARLQTGIRPGMQTEAALWSTLAYQQGQLGLTGLQHGSWQGQLDLQWRQDSGSSRQPQAYGEDLPRELSARLQQDNQWQWQDYQLGLGWLYDQGQQKRPVLRGQAPFSQEEHRQEMGLSLGFKQPIAGNSLESQLHLNHSQQDNRQNAVRTPKIEQQRLSQQWELEAQQDYDFWWADSWQQLGWQWQGQQLQQQTRLQGQPGKTEVPLSEQQLLGAYSQSSWFFGQQLELNLGQRVQHLPSGWLWLPKLNVIHQGANWQQQLSLGRGFRQPTLKEQFFFFDHSQLGYLVLGNPDLQTERNWSLQLSNQSLASSNLGSGQQWQMALYGHWLEDLIVTEFVQMNEQGHSVFAYNNIHQAWVLGGHVQWQHQIHSQYWLQLQLELLHSRNLDNGKALAKRSPVRLSLNDRWQLTERLNWQQQIRWQAASFMDNDNQLQSPAWTSWRSVANYHWSNDLQLYMGVNNLLNHYQMLDSQGDLLPLVGREWFLGFDYQLSFSANQ